MTRFTCRVRRISGVVSTDDIIPGRYKHMYTDPQDLAGHVFENLYPGFADTLQSGDVLVSDALFGIGSSREQAVSALRAAGVDAVIAPAFGRIFFRNAWNLALPAIEAAGASEKLAEGDRVGIDLEAGTVDAPQGGFEFAPPPGVMLEMLNHGGLLEMVRRRIQADAPGNDARS